MYLTTFNRFPVANAIDHFFDNWFDSALPASQTALAPRVDIREEEGGKVVLEAELPGVKKEDIQVAMENGVLRITAEKKASKEVKARDSYIAERSFGRYERSFRLSDTIDSESIQASHENGVLRLEMKHKAGSLSRQINIA